MRKVPFGLSFCNEALSSVPSEAADDDDDLDMESLEVLVISRDVDGGVKRIS